MGFGDCVRQILAGAFVGSGIAYFLAYFSLVVLGAGLSVLLALGGDAAKWSEGMVYLLTRCAIGIIVILLGVVLDNQRTQLKWLLPSSAGVSFITTLGIMAYWYIYH